MGHWDRLIEFSVLVGFFAREGYENIQLMHSRCMCERARDRETPGAHFAHYTDRIDSSEFLRMVLPRHQVRTTLETLEEGKVSLRCAWTWIRFEDSPRDGCLHRLEVWHRDRISSTTRRYLQRFYRFGSFFSVCVGLLTSCLLVYTFLRMVFLAFCYRASRAEVFQASADVFSPVVPGVNLPWTDAGHLWCALGLSLVVHEAGHALALVVNGARADGAGCFIFGPFPAAYVRFNRTALQPLPVKGRLDVFLGGVWHNIVFAAVAVMFAYCIVPACFCLFFRAGQGAVIVGGDTHSWTSQVSPFSMFEQRIVEVNDVLIKSTSDWTAEVSHAAMLNRTQNTVKLRNMKGYEWQVHLELNGLLAAYNGIVVDDNFPRFKSLSGGAGGFSGSNILRQLQHAIRRQCLFLVVINTSLAGTNTLPIYYFDGQHVLAILMARWAAMRGGTSKRALHRHVHWILRGGSALLFANLIASYLTVTF